MRLLVVWWQYEVIKILWMDIVRLFCIPLLFGGNMRLSKYYGWILYGYFVQW